MLEICNKKTAKMKVMGSNPSVIVLFFKHMPTVSSEHSGLSKDLFHSIIVPADAEEETYSNKYSGR